MRHHVSLVLIAAALAACNAARDRSVGQSTFESAPPNGSRGGGDRVNGLGDAGAGDKAPPSPTQPVPERKVEETDLYRLEGNRLYYLNAYRGLMVFDVTNPDQPALLGRSPIFGQPVDMIVRNGVATVVIGDWFGKMEDGTPFHGSIVRGLDATDPAHIRLLGEAKLGGWVRDDRVVGDVIYAVSEDVGWWYGWGTEDGGGVSTTAHQPAVIVSSVSFANGVIEEVDQVRYDGYGGVFNVTPTSIMMASSTWPGPTSLLYLDISDPGGRIRQRGSFQVAGWMFGWGPDNGRWNLDFADGVTAHVLGQNEGYNTGYVLSTVDFSNPDAPALQSSLPIAYNGWGAAARFDAGRLYLSPEGYYYGGQSTPLQVFDLTSSIAPRLVGTVSLPGQVWNILPAPGSRIFALGNDYQGGAGSPVSLKYLDVTDPAAPQLLGTSQFGQGWAWTPAAGTFKAFTMDATRGLVVLPFAGWDSNSFSYNNGLQLIQFTPSSVTTAGAARTKGWVERGIFVGNRLVSLSNQSLAVVDYTDVMTPRVIKELTLARNVVTAQPLGATIAEISSDWWDNTTSSQVRILPIAGAEETADVGEVPTLDVEGSGAQVFSNGRYSYIVSSVATDTPCPNSGGGYKCFLHAQQIQVVDLAGGAPVARGVLRLPTDGSDWWGWGWGWGGFWWWDWWGGSGVVQVGGDVLAFRRWVPKFDDHGSYVDSDSKLFVVDLANPDAPRFSSLVVQDDRAGWWGNMKVVGTTLYTTHYEWVDDPENDHGWVRYYLDSIDLRDRSRPRIGAKVNVPGLLVGGNAADPSIVYTVDYRWGDGSSPVNDFDVLRIEGSRASLLSHVAIRGWVGSTSIVGTTAYLSAQQYDASNTGISSPRVDLHAIDLANPSRPRDRIASDSGWGWLLGVVGDRALVTSGWGGEQAIDIYQLRDGQAPRFDQTVRTRGWSVNGVSRQDQTLFLSSGYWGVQTIPLQ